MDKKNKKILIVLLSIIIILGYWIYYLPDRKIEIDEDLVVNNLPEQVPLTDIVVEKRSINKIENITIREKAAEQGKNVTLIVFDKNYEIEIVEGDSVFKSMETLQKGNDFTFSYKKYPSLGIFVDKINQVEGGGGKYWIYSVNGEESTIGVSEYILKVGDIIKWELK